MSDTARLYALSSVYTHPALPPGLAGPTFLINDAVLAMRWYLTHEREQYLAVTGQVSYDGGAIWQTLGPHHLMADAEEILGTRTEPGTPAGARPVALLLRALEREAADWLDHRLRFAPPGDPAPRRGGPTLAAWRRGGQIWAVTMGTPPRDHLLAHLAASHPASQDGLGVLQDAARRTLDALAAAQDPYAADLDVLMRAFHLLDRLTFYREAGQVTGHARAVCTMLLDHMATRHPQTARVTARYPDPAHPVHRVARVHLRHLAQITVSGEEALRDDARSAFDDDAQEAQADMSSAGAGFAGETGQPAASAVPGYPKPLEGHLVAAAAWRLRSPIAGVAATAAMADLTQAADRLADVTARGPQVASPFAARRQRKETDEARSHYKACKARLNDLDLQHALLTHASVLADAKVAADEAHDDLRLTAGKGISASAPGFRPSAYEQFRTNMDQGGRQIAEIFGQQRQMTRDALYELFPSVAGRRGMAELRRQLVDDAGFHPAATLEAREAVETAKRRLEELQQQYDNGYPLLGHPPVSAERLVQAWLDVDEAEQRAVDLTVSRPATLRAVDALERVADLEPSSPGLAAHAARIAAHSRERAHNGRGLPAGPTPPRGEDGQRAHHPQQPRQVRPHWG